MDISNPGSEIPTHTLNLGSGIPTDTPNLDLGFPQTLQTRDLGFPWTPQTQDSEFPAPTIPNPTSLLRAQIWDAQECRISLHPEFLQHPGDLKGDPRCGPKGDPRGDPRGSRPPWPC